MKNARQAAREFELYTTKRNRYVGLSTSSLERIKSAMSRIAAEESDAGQRQDGKRKIREKKAAAA